jgi:GNAT superfamily N-acetyltransferase
MAPNLRVRLATAADEAAVLAAVRDLIRELASDPAYELPAGAALTFQRLVAGDVGGCVLVAEADDAASLLGVATISLQAALRAGGRYAELQELWVAPTARSRNVGAALIAAADHYCRDQEVSILEVGLPSPAFPHLERTSAFYEKLQFALIGPRRRRIVPQV